MAKNYLKKIKNKVIKDAKQPNLKKNSGNKLL